MAQLIVAPQLASRFAPWLILSACLLATMLIWHEVRQSEEKKAQLAFDAEVKEVHGRIEARLQSYSLILKGVRGLFASAPAVDLATFKAYLEPLNLAQHYPGIQGVGYAQLIMPQERLSLIARMRNTGFPQFAISPLGERARYSAILFLEPLDWRNQRAIGYDMYAEPIRHAAMDYAGDIDAPAISGKVQLVQEAGHDVQSGFLMYVPLYRSKLPLHTVDERRGKLSGWVYAPFRMQDLMRKGVLGKYLETMEGQLDIEIYDGDNASASSLLFDSSTSSATAADSGRAHFSSVRTTQYFGRNWTLVVRSLPAFEAKLAGGRSLVIALGGILVSLMLTLIVWLLSTNNVRAAKLAEKMVDKQSLTLTQTIASLATVIEMRDPYTAGHQRRAAAIAGAIAVEMGLQGERLRALNLAASIYEIGKIQVPAEILSKPGKLDAIEYGMIQTHAQSGFEILRGIDFPWPIAKIVQQHHERLDGSGYPLGLKAADILLEARIIAVADVIEAMCSHRPYRPELGLEAALLEITSGSGVLYDSTVVHACKRLFRERGFGIPN